MTERDSASFSFCRNAVAEMSRRHGWGLGDQQIDAYANQILLLVPDAVIRGHLETVVRYFHSEHRTVADLRDEGAVGYVAAWAWVRGEVIRAAQFKNLDWSQDRAVEVDDLVQVAQAEVARSLHNYHFKSSLRTWVQNVTLRRLARFHRDNGAVKRSIRPAPLESLDNHAVHWDSFEQQALASALAAEIRRILDSSGDVRYARIFHLHLIDDRTLREVGAMIGLHPSRVRTLLQELRELLRQSEQIRGWRSDDGENAPGDTQDRP